jgi:hypothetical protein
MNNEDDLDTLLSEAKKDMREGAGYIAFHGAGQNALKVLNLVDKLMDNKLVDENYQLKYGTSEKTSHAILFTAILVRNDMVK